MDMLEFLTRLREADEKARGIADGALAGCGERINFVEGDIDPKTLSVI